MSPRDILVSKSFLCFLGAVVLTFVLWFAFYSKSLTKSTRSYTIRDPNEDLFDSSELWTVANKIYNSSQIRTHDRLCSTWKCRNYDPNSLAQRNLMTIVSAYFNLGTFPKGSISNPRSPQTYRKWAEIFSKILSNLVFYSDDEAFANHILEIRSNAVQRTCICMIDRKTLWSFSIIPRIAKLFEEPGYPKHLPNTVVPEYGASMHAKYELMHIAASENVFATDYFAWVDVGLYRALVDQVDFSRVRSFELALPPKFNPQFVAYTMVDQPNFERSLDDYCKHNLVWVCGCFFLAHKTVMKEWTVEYLRFVDLLLYIGLGSTDQQVIYGMFNKVFAFSTQRPRVHIQQYVPPGSGDGNYWFYLGYLCRHEGLNQRNRTVLNQDVLTNSSSMSSTNKDGHIVTTADSKEPVFYYEL